MATYKGKDQTALLRTAGVVQACHNILISPSPFWKRFPRSRSFIFKMAAMLQIPPVIPRVSCLRSAKAVQCPRPGSNIGDKSQQNPRYHPLCPRGHPTGMAADKCNIIFPVV